MHGGVVRLVDRQSGGRTEQFDPNSMVAAIIANAEQLARQAKAVPPASRDYATFVRRVIAAREERRNHFNSQLFADPAWDILLELFALHCEQRRISVSKLCLAAGVPGTTALRWIEKLVSDDLATRKEDPYDARRVWVSLSDKGIAAMTAYLEAISSDLHLL